MLTFAVLWSVNWLLVLNNSLVNYSAVYYHSMDRDKTIEVSNSQILTLKGAETARIY